MAWPSRPISRAMRRPTLGGVSSGVATGFIHSSEIKNNSVRSKASVTEVSAAGTSGRTP